MDGVTATAYDVREGKKFVTADGNLVSGLQPDRGTWSTTLPINGNVTIPSGIHSGNGKVSQNIPVMQAQTITPSLNGTTVQTYQKYMTGNVKINPIPNQRIAGTKNNSCGINGSGLFYYIPEGYYIPDSTGFSWVYATLPDVAAALGITPDKVKKGTTLCGVTGTWEGYVAGVNDLYYNGINAAGFQTNQVLDYVTVEYQNTCIQIVSKTSSGNSAKIIASKSYNFTGYRNIVMEFEVSGTSSNGNMGIYLSRDSGSNSSIASFTQAFPEGKNTIRASLAGHQTSFKLVVRIAPQSKTMRINRIYLE